MPSEAGSAQVGCSGGNVSTARIERLHTCQHLSRTVLALALLSTALASAQERKSAHWASSAIAPFPSQEQQTNWVTITNRRIIEDGSTDHSYNSVPAVVDARGGDYVLSYRKGTGHSDS